MSRFPKTAGRARIARVLAAICLALITGACENKQVYSVKLLGIRALVAPPKPVSLSLWLYDAHGTVVAKVFEDGKLNAKTAGWVRLKKSVFEKIPSKSIDQGGRFDWIVKLNPNRFAQRPDAEFTGSFRLTAPAEGGEGLTSVRAVSQGPGGEYEIELLFRVE